jgi:ATP-dependent DNA helicase RecG
MRPEVLFSLFSSVSTLPGIGPRMEKLIAKAAGPHVVDLLWHLPTGVVDRRYQPKISEVKEGEIATLTVQVDEHFPSSDKRRPYRVRCSDETGFITLVFFHAHKDYLKKTLPIGETRIISGTIEFYQDVPQMSHPDYMIAETERALMPLIEPLYPLTAGLSVKTLHKALNAGLKLLPDFPEWQDEPWIKKNQWPTWQSALTSLHRPELPETLEEKSPARRRLAFDELLASQLALRLTRAKMKRSKGRALSGDSSLRNKVLEALPFSLTKSQEIANQEIAQDMASGDRMLRMLQGDVGSGKTLVALTAMLTAVEAGTQGALMAPTEILAHQHFESIEPLAKAAGIRIELLTGRAKSKARTQILSDLADGTINILIGTHALFQEDVVFKDLGLAVVDEQHRFGVHQRIALSEKGPVKADILVMTATPIPRTLTLTYYGDMDLSLLKEKPPGRQSIVTRAMPVERISDVFEAVRRALHEGDRLYWVCPLVEESDLIDLQAAEDRFASLKAIFGDVVGLVHGRMKSAEKESAMAKFQSGETKLLVATTVIEVGVDVPEATIIIIEHAERFGLSQLHQLRGRVGRGTRPSSCLLLYQGPLGETAKARLKIIRETDDGFRIAEEDLRLRGPGDVMGVRQSGLPVFRVADLNVHADLLTAAHHDAEMIVRQDPDLNSDRGRALRVLLYLFEKDEAVKYLKSG